MIALNPSASALVLIDLQKGIVGRPLAPRSGEEIVAGAKALAGRFREAGAPVALVNVAWSADGGDMLRQPVDRATRPPGALPADWAELADGLAQAGDLRVTKRQWGAFHGTDLDLQLRRRGVKTIVLGGIATNFGVESTARQAWEHGYEVVLAEDLTATLSDEMQAFAVGTIFPAISRVARAEDVILARA